MHSFKQLYVIDTGSTGIFPTKPLAAALKQENPQVISATLDNAQKELENNNLSSALIVIDLGLSGEEVLPQLQAFVARQSNNTVIVVGNISDLRFYRTLIAAGVKEYFPYPVKVDEIIDALGQHKSGVANHPATPAATNGRGHVAAFVSAASGDGSSTVALNTAYALAHHFQQPTVIIDMDYQFGMIARHLDVNAPFGIRELFDNPDRGIDATLVSKMLFAYGDNMRIIAAPSELKYYPLIKPEIISELIQVLRSQFAFVIIDTPHIWADWTSSILSGADSIVPVSQLWLRSLTHFTRMQNTWQENGIDLSKISLTINRSGARFREAITPQDFTRVSGRSVQAFIANDIKTVVQAENQGKTIIELGSSQLQREFKQLAKHLLETSGQAFHDAEAEEEQEKEKKGGLFSLIGKR